ncbi:MAG: diguanylate cyclase [Gammaproteobacteria bacterium]|nr:diguanylate cyclase [Gammaproteobacteria bacterium]
MLKIDIKEFHWMMDMIQHLDVGLIVLDKEYKVNVWNSFMENHSGYTPNDVIGKNLFEVFKNIPESWFKRKSESVFLLNNRAFTTWEQRPYLFKFKNYRPITGSAAFMYQDITLIPLTSVDGTVNHIGVIIYDVTDIAVNKLGLKVANEELGILSRTDMLTKLYNRGYWEERLLHEFSLHKRNKQAVSLVMFDIDHFKKVNDTYGHQAGDEVIRVTSKLLIDCKRETDIAGRYGGEEFAVILLDSTAQNALLFTERLRKRIEESRVSVGSDSIKFTVSLGISDLTEKTQDYEEWLKQSDMALYRAKESGRNQSVIYDVNLNGAIK